MKFHLSVYVYSILAIAIALPAAAKSREELTDNASGATSTETTPWPLTDALGRSAPVEGESRVPRHDRFVGIFYFLWHNNRGGARPEGGPYDIAGIFARDPNALDHPGSGLWGPVGLYHYWSEPLFGYYLGEDPWVIRRHARLLEEAGIDTLIFDTTNAETYPSVYTKLGQVFTAIRKEGGRTPAIAFMVNTEAGKTASRLYQDLYRPGRFRDLWFRWQGKPLLICDPESAAPELRAFFTLRRAHWPFTMVNTRNAWHWEAAYPQSYGYTEDPDKPEQVNVSVAQNLRVSDAKVTNMSDGDARGRSFHDGVLDRSPGAVLHGHNVHEQWKRAMALDPPFVMVTGWNEWIAGRFGEPDGKPEFVDQFDQEFSRDIEPMRGGHGDNYYCQLVGDIRRFKGVPRFPRSTPPRTIHVSEGFDQWEGVGPLFRDDAGDSPLRDHDGAGGLHYENRSGRNDLVEMKVASDKDNIYFYLRTREPIKPQERPRGLWLLIDLDQDPRTGWEGFDYIVNRSVDEDGTSWLERNEGGWNWIRVAKVHWRIDGRQFQLAVARAAFASSKQDDTAFDFKWADNLQRPGDVMDFYLSGDVAPEGRFKFRYLPGN
jgi:hypothetical protein